MLRIVSVTIASPNDGRKRPERIAPVERKRVDDGKEAEGGGSITYWLRGHDKQD